MDISRPAVDQNVNEADVEESVSACYGAHEQLNDVPLVEAQQLLVS